jgi:hypothetical protein
MDQQLLVLSSPVEQQLPPLSPPNNAPVSKPKAKPGAKKASNHIEILTPELTKEVPVESKQIPAKKVTKRAQSVKKTVEKPQAARADPPPLEAVFEPPAPPPREISPTLEASARNQNLSRKKPSQRHRYKTYFNHHRSVSRPRRRPHNPYEAAKKVP